MIWSYTICWLYLFTSDTTIIMVAQWELKNPIQDRSPTSAGSPTVLAPAIWQAQAVALQKNIKKAIDQWQWSDQIKSTILGWNLWYTPEQIQAQIDVVTKSNNFNNIWVPATPVVSNPQKTIDKSATTGVKSSPYVFWDAAIKANEQNPTYIEKRNQELAAKIAWQYNPDDSQSLTKATQDVLTQAWITQAQWVTPKDLQNTIQNIQWLVMNMKFGDDAMNQIQNMSSGELADKLLSWVISENDMAMKALKISNPAKYQEVIAMRNDSQRYDSYNSSFTTDPEESNAIQDATILDKNAIWADIMSWKFWNQPTLSVSDVYNQFLNTDAIQSKTEAKNQLQLDVNKIDEDLYNLKSEIEDQYKGKVFSESAIAAIYNDRAEALDKKKRTKLLELNAAIADLNSVQEQWSRNYELYLKQTELDRQATQDKMQQLWFAMQLMSYETPQQKDDREWAKFIKQQDYVNGNINSSDPSARKKAVEKAVDGVLAEFDGIPMVRSRDQMVEDIQKMVDSWSSLWQAITENIRNPIREKPEYKLWLNNKLWVSTDPQKITLGWMDYLFKDWALTPYPESWSWRSSHPMRTDRHNNPTAFTTDVAKQAWLIEWKDYVRWGAFYNNPNLFTARLLWDPIDTTIRVIDKIWFYTASWGQRRSHTAYTKQQWDSMDNNQKRAVVASMYQKEWGDGSLLSWWSASTGWFKQEYASVYKAYLDNTLSASFLKESWLDFNTMAKEAQAYVNDPEVKKSSLNSVIQATDTAQSLLDSMDSWLTNTDALWKWWVPNTKARDFRNQFEFLRSIKWLDFYIAAKKSWATFGNLSDGDLQFLLAAANGSIKLGSTPEEFRAWLNKIIDVWKKLQGIVASDLAKTWWWGDIQNFFNWVSSQSNQWWLIDTSGLP